MKDPTRIPAVLDELRTTWEGQPDLSLATLFGILQNNGIGWGADDVELVDALKQLQHQNPARIGPDISARYVVDTQGPDNRITIDPYRVIVRRMLPRGQHTQPGVWSYTAINRCAVGSPLVITDEEGMRHRLGVVSSIRLVNADPQPSEDNLSGLSRELIHDRVLLCRLAGDITVVVSRTLSIFTPSRRSLEHTTQHWAELPQVRPGQPLLVKAPRTTAVRELGLVEDCFYVEG